MSSAEYRQAIHPIEVNSNARNITVDSTILFPLPDRPGLQLHVTETRTLANGDRQIVARFDKTGVAIITFGKNSVFANIDSNEHHFTLSVDANQRPVLINSKLHSSEIDLRDDMRHPTEIHSPQSFQSQTSGGQQATAICLGPNGKNEITLLAIYSNEFAIGFADPVTRINQAIAFTNAAYDRSGINIELTLSHAEQIAFDNSASTGTLLTAVTDGTGSFSGVAALRDQHFSDMVAVLPYRSSGGIAGIAWVSRNRPDLAFSISQFASFSSGSLFAHELGHNLGSGHEWPAANPMANPNNRCTGGVTGYACGHGNGSQGTIMSYLNDSAWSFVFSNPQLSCLGEPCGVSSGQANPADNRRSFNLTGPEISNFRVDFSNDDDQDCVKNEVDNCPNIKNTDQRDTNDDGEGDACDNDDDGDGFNDDVDNCPLIDNPEQEDQDGNGIGDLCDSETCVPIKSSNGGMALICL